MTATGAILLGVVGALIAFAMWALTNADVPTHGDLSGAENQIKPDEAESPFEDDDILTPMDEMPEDFPHVEIFNRAGIIRFIDLPLHDLERVKGIGPSRAETVQTFIDRVKMYRPADVAMPNRECDECQYEDDCECEKTPTAEVDPETGELDVTTQSN